MKRNIFIMVPAYNASTTLEAVFARIPEKVRSRVARYVIVDDGSTDDTAGVAERIASNHVDVVVLRHDRNRGYGQAEKTLLDFARGEGAEYVVLLHADGQYSPELILEMVAPLESGEADIVQGSRMASGGALKGGMPLYKFVANKALTWIANLTLRLRMSEYYSGYMAYGSRSLNEIPYHQFQDSFQFDLEMIVAAHVRGLRVAQIAIPTIYAGEKSHLNPVRYGFNVLAVLWAYKRGRYDAKGRG